MLGDSATSEVATVIKGENGKWYAFDPQNFSHPVPIEEWTQARTMKIKTGEYNFFVTDPIRVDPHRVDPRGAYKKEPLEDDDLFGMD